MSELLKYKIKIRQIKNLLKKAPRSLARHPFLTFCVFLISAFILSGFIFYQYVILVEKSEIKTSKKIFKFEETTYQEVLNQWQQREERLKDIDTKTYLNSFQGIKKEILSPTSTEPTTSTSEATTTPEATSTPEENPPEVPEQPSPPSNIERLLTATNLYEFYIINNGWVPSVRQRAKVWQEKGLGTEDDYKGAEYQNIILLNKLKEELTK